MTVHASFTTVHSPTMCRATHKSDVFSYSECKIVKFFRSFTSGPHWGQLTTPSNPQPPTHRSQQWFFSLLHSSKNWHPPNVVLFKFTTPETMQTPKKSSLTISMQYFSLAATYCQGSFSAPFKFVCE